jgi:hypothetical protein
MPDLGKGKLPERYRQLSGLYAELESETRDLIVNAGPDVSKVSRTQRRMIVRSVFAFIEAIAYSMKNIAANKTIGKPVPASDKFIASEIVYDLSEKGEAIARPMKLRLAPNVRYTFSLFKRCYETSTDLDVAGEGWQSFLRSIKVRDRITHPKSTDDISISDKELINVIETLNWFKSSFQTAITEGLQVLETTTDSLLKQNEDLRRKAERHRGLETGGKADS